MKDSHAITAAALIGACLAFLTAALLINMLGG